MPALTRLLRDDFHACEFKAHGTSVPLSVLHLEDDVFVKKFLEEFVFLKKSDQVPDTAYQKDEDDNTNVNLRVRPPAAYLFLRFLNDV